MTILVTAAICDNVNAAKARSAALQAYTTGRFTRVYKFSNNAFFFSFLFALLSFTFAWNALSLRKYAHKEGYDRRTSN